MLANMTIHHEITATMRLHYFHLPAFDSIAVSFCSVWLCDVKTKYHAEKKN